MTHPTPLTAQQVAVLRAGATRAMAQQAGITPDKVRGPLVERAFRGVYTLPDPKWATRVRAALLAAGDPSFACESTGLRLLGRVVPSRLDGDAIHVWVPAAQVGPRMPGIRVHRSQRQCDPITYAGVGCLHPVECWLQLAARASVRDLVVMADGLMTRSNPVTTLTELSALVNGSHRRPGLRKARVAVGLARERTDSPMETLTRLALVEAGLPCPEVNAPALDGSGLPLYWIDMAYTDRRIGIEYDGRDHGLSRDQMEWDATRRRWLQDHGWYHIPVTAADARAGFRGVVSSVRAALAHRPPHPQPPVSALS